MIKALFFDIDGTLVSFHTHQIPESALEALEKVRAKGIKIFISTGRPPVIITNLGAMQKRGLIDGYITMNGSYVYVENQVISKRAIDRTCIDRVTAYCDARHITYLVVGERDICVCHSGALYQQIFYDNLSADIRIPEKSPEDALPEGKEVLQLTPFLSEADVLALQTDLLSVEAGRWHPAFIDITTKGSNKQQGMVDMLRHFGIRREETMAFGDGGNDISMIQFAHIGVALGNANPELKQVADHITSSVDEDGVKNALLHFQLI